MAGVVAADAGAGRLSSPPWRGTCRCRCTGRRTAACRRVRTLRSGPARRVAACRSAVRSDVAHLDAALAAGTGQQLTVGTSAGREGKVVLERGLPAAADVQISSRLSALMSPRRRGARRGRTRPPGSSRARLGGPDRRERARVPEPELALVVRDRQQAPVRAEVGRERELVERLEDGARLERGGVEQLDRVAQRRLTRSQPLTLSFLSTVALSRPAPQLTVSTILLAALTESLPAPAE